MLILTPSIIESIGSDGYGLWLLILSVLAFFNIIELGFPAAVQRFVTLYLEKSDRETANLYLTTSLFLFLFLGVLSASVALIVFQFPQFLGLEPSLDDLLLKVAIIFAIKIIVDFTMNPIHAIYSAHLRVDIDAALTSLNVVVKSILIYFVGRHDGIVAMALCAVFTDILVNIIKVTVAKRIYPYWRLKREYVSYEGFLNLFNFSKYIIIMAFARMVNQRSAPILISNILSVNSVAVFGVAQNLINHADSLNSSIFQAFSAFFTKIVARGDELTEYVAKTARLCFLVCLLLTLNLLFFSGTFIKIWLGDDFLLAAEIISILAFTLLNRPYSVIFRNVLIAQANHKYLMYVSIFGSASTILLTLTLGSQFGLLGVAVAFVSISYITQFVLFRIIFKKYNEVSLFKVDIFFILSLLLSLLAFSYSHYVFAPEDSWYMLILDIVLFNLLVLPPMALLFLPKEFLKQFFHLLKNKLNSH